MSRLLLKRQTLDDKRMNVSSHDEGKRSTNSVYVHFEIEKVEAIVLDPNSLEEVVFVGEKLFVSHKKSLFDMLIKNKEVFAYSHCDMPRIDPSFISYVLNVDVAFKPIKLKKMRYSSEMYDINGWRGWEIIEGMIY